jgi:hypothetical protein
MVNKTIVNKNKPPLFPSFGGAGVVSSPLLWRGARGEVKNKMHPAVFCANGSELIAFLPTYRLYETATTNTASLRGAQRRSKPK